MTRVFLDANVLFSASDAKSNIAFLIHLLIGQGKVVTSDYAFQEARRNVQLKRPSWAKSLDTLIHQVEVVQSIQFTLPIQLSSKDQPILCTTIRSGCQYLATGDRKDFGHLYNHTVQGVTIISLVQLAKIVLQMSENESWL